MAVRTKAELQAEIDAKLADNEQGDISAQDVREVAEDLTDSASFGAFALGPQQNTFVGADRAVAQSVRDDYASANAEWLALYNTNRENKIGLAEDVAGPYFAFQRRNVAGDAWEDVTGVVRGGGSATAFLTATPDDTVGDDGDTALVRRSSIVVHAYLKVSGAWVRQWAFSGGDSVLLASGAPVPDRYPAIDPDGNEFIRVAGISGYRPVTQDDVDHSSQNVNTVADLRGGIWGNTFGARANTLPDQTIGPDFEYFTGINFSDSVPLYVWFGLERATESRAHPHQCDVQRG